jgi:uncharacterized phage protein (TIGR01671 family)
MSRPIEFRAWDVNEDEYVSWEQLINTRYNQDYLKDNVGKDSPILSFMTDKYLIKEQWIGRYDKNKIKIFESDILSLNKFMKDGKELGIVIFSNGSFLAEVDSCFHRCAYIDDECEIVGNVRENPELMKAIK